MQSEYGRSILGNAWRLRSTVIGVRQLHVLGVFAVTHWIYPQLVKTDASWINLFGVESKLPDHFYRADEGH